mgnify:CR=1 FL=1
MLSVGHYLELSGEQLYFGIVLNAIDLKKFKVNIFTGSKNNWKILHSYLCTIGKKSTPTPKGTFLVGIKGLYFGVKKGYKCWYYTQFKGNYLFHSILYNLDGNFVKEMCNIASTARELGVHYGTVYQVIQGKRKSVKNYQIKRKESDDFSKKIAPYNSKQGGAYTVLQLDKDDNILNEYKSVNEAAR